MSTVEELVELTRWRLEIAGEYQRALDRFESTRRHDELVSALYSLRLSRSDLSDSSDARGEDIARLAAVADVALPAIVSRLDVVAGALRDLAVLLASPQETAAAEGLRAGERALAAADRVAEAGSPELADEWLDEAISVLTGAVSCFAQLPRAWFLLAVALDRRKEAERASDAYARAARHALESAPAAAAWAVLLAAGLHRRSGNASASLELLRRYAKPLDRCAEIHLCLAVHHANADANANHLLRALTLAPALAADARMAGIPTAESAAAVACTAADSPVARLRALEAAIAAFDDETVPDAVALPPAGIDALLISEAAIVPLTEVARSLASAAEAEIDVLVEAAEAAGRGLSDAQARHAAAITRSKSEPAVRAAAIEAEADKIRQRIAAREQSFSAAERNARWTRLAALEAGLDAAFAEAAIKFGVRVADNDHFAFLNMPSHGLSREAMNALNAFQAKLTTSDVMRRVVAALDRGRAADDAHRRLEKLRASASADTFPSPNVPDSPDRLDGNGKPPLSWEKAVANAEASRHHARRAAAARVDFTDAAERAAASARRYRTWDWYRSQPGKGGYAEPSMSIAEFLAPLPEAARLGFVEDEQRRQRFAEMLAAWAAEARSRAETAEQVLDATVEAAGQLVAAAAADAAKRAERECAAELAAAAAAVDQAVVAASTASGRAREAREKRATALAAVAEAVALATKLRERIVPGPVF
jgi:hypothetical protein